MCVAGGAVQDIKMTRNLLWGTRRWQRCYIIPLRNVCDGNTSTLHRCLTHTLCKIFKLPQIQILQDFFACEMGKMLSTRDTQLIPTIRLIVFKVSLQIHRSSCKVARYVYQAH